MSSPVRSPVAAPAQQPDTALGALAAEIDLPPATAVWVMLAHLLTVMTPLPLLWAVIAHREFLLGAMHRVDLYFVGAALLMCGSGLEFAQNTVDRWYITRATPSGLGHGLCDLLFYTLMGTALTLFSHAASGQLLWLTALSAGGVLLFVLLYLRGKTPYPGLGIVGSCHGVALYLALGDPIVFLHLLCGTGMTGYFAALMFRTENQVLHGFTTLGNGLGMLAVPWAIHTAASGGTHSWGFAASIFGAGVLLAALLWRPLGKLAPTPRPSASVAG